MPDMMPDMMPDKKVAKDLGKKTPEAFGVVCIESVLTMLSSSFFTAAFC